jgi:hypothetical protein
MMSVVNVSSPVLVVLRARKSGDVMRGRCGGVGSRLPSLEGRVAVAEVQSVIGYVRRKVCCRTVAVVDWLHGQLGRLRIRGRGGLRWDRDLIGSPRGYHQSTVPWHAVCRDLPVKSCVARLICLAGGCDRLVNASGSSEWRWTAHTERRPWLASGRYYRCMRKHMC